MRPKNIIICAISLTLLLSCGGGKNSAPSIKPSIVSFEGLEDYYTIEAVTCESDAKEKGIANLQDVRGVFSFTVKRHYFGNTIKPSYIEDADLAGYDLDENIVFYNYDVTSAIRKLVTAADERDDTYTLEIPFKMDNDIVDRKLAYDALVNANWGSIEFDIDVEFPSSSSGSNTLRNRDGDLDDLDDLEENMEDLEDALDAYVDMLETLGDLL